MISFTIPGRVRGKGRPRATAMSVKGKTYVRTYTDAKTVSAEGLVRHFASQAMYGLKPFEGAIHLDVVIFQHTPKSWSKKRTAGAKWITGKPDCDNVLKLLADSMNRLVYLDDAQIAKVSVSREYANYMPEQVQVTVRELSEAQEARAAA